LNLQLQTLSIVCFLHEDIKVYDILQLHFLHDPPSQLDVTCACKVKLLFISQFPLLPFSTLAPCH